MDILKKHEAFEIEVLECLSSGKFLEPLVFGGGTMLRLCYELDRYSADLDFWFIKKARQRDYFWRLRKFLSDKYELTDAQIKFYTLLFEVRSKNYPKRLKIEIRKGIKKCDFQERIAFSKYGTRQVILKAHTLEQTMKNKIEAAIDRREARDCYDIEFMLKRGIPLVASRDKLAALKKAAEKFSANDIKTKLGPFLEADVRKYYTANRFQFLSEKITSELAS